MSRRRILLLCGFLVIAAICLGFYVPQYFSPIPELVEEMASLLVPTREEAIEAEEASAAAEKIEMDVVVTLADLSGMGMPLFSDRDGEGRGVSGLVKDSDRLFALMQQMRREDCLSTLGNPRLLTWNGRAGNVMSGGQAPFVDENGVCAMKFYGLSVKAVPTLRKDGRIHLHLTTAYCEPPDFAETSLQGSVVVPDGQTCFFAGVAWKGKRSTAVGVPLLSDVPGVGPWFRLTREVEIDQALLVLLTPTVVADR